MSEEPRRRARDDEGPRSSFPLPVVVGVALIAVLAVGSLIFLGNNLRGEEPGAPPVVVNSSGTDPNAAATPAGQRRIPVEGLTKGHKDAPIEIIEYADFQ